MEVSLGSRFSSFFMWSCFHVNVVSFSGCILVLILLLKEYLENGKEIFRQKFEP